MEKDLRYLTVVDVTFPEIVTACAFGDMAFMGKHLKNMKLHKNDFIQLCRTAIDISNEAVLRFLLDAYYQYWTTEVFKKLYDYARLKKAWQFFRFLDIYIDNANAKIEATEKKLEEQRLKEEKKNKKKYRNRWYRLYNFIKRYISFGFFPELKER